MGTDIRRRILCFTFVAALSSLASGCVTLGAGCADACFNVGCCLLCGPDFVEMEEDVPPDEGEPPPASPGPDPCELDGDAPGADACVKDVSLRLPY